MRTETMSIKQFMNGDYKGKKGKSEVKRVFEVVTLASGTAFLVLPQVAAAAPGSIDGTFDNVHRAIMNAFDAGIVLVIIFAGAAWALGHRTKAIEIIIGVCCGYILARHAVDIRDMLKGI